MKKFLVIFIMSLMWFNSSFANSIPDLANSKWQVRKSVPIKKQFFEFYDSGRCRYSFKDLGIFKYEYDDCEWRQNGSKFQITTYSNNNNRSDYEGTIYPNSLSGKYINKHYGSIDFTGTPVFIKQTLSTENTNTSSSSGTDDKIAKSKKICKELGFKANSEKFADCALKMMAMQFETGSKVSNNDGSSTQKIIVKQQDDFDIGDFFFGLQKIVDDNYRSSNNSSSNQGTNCRIVPKAWGADMVCR